MVIYFLFRASVGRVEWNITGYVLSFFLLSFLLSTNTLPPHYPHHLAPSSPPQATTAGSDSGKPPLAGACGDLRGVSGSSRLLLMTMVTVKIRIRIKREVRGTLIWVSWACCVHM
jgi:hypothetical protein